MLAAAFPAAEVREDPEMEPLHQKMQELTEE